MANVIQCSGSTGSFEKQIVLVVDDTPENIAVLSSLLRGQYHIKVALTGELALEIAGSREARPDLILLDIMMPGMDGFEVCRRLKENECLQDIPVIFLSALNETMDKVKAFGVGAIDYITKPFHAEEVQARVENHLKVRRLQLELERQNRELQDHIEELRHCRAIRNEPGLDIAVMKTTQNQLLHDAREDPLTGLANRSAFMHAIQYALDRRIRHPEYAFAILFIDLDRFKSINDSMGHLVGDELFKEVARRLLKCVRTSDYVARLGGDEFTVLLDDINGACVGIDATKTATRILLEIARPFELAGKSIQTTASIGIAVSTSDYIGPDDIIRDADTAMYMAKQAGRGGYRIVDAEMHENASRQLSLETDLRAAVLQNQFVIHYQPIVWLADGSVMGFEALVRWHHPVRGMISPLDFIPMAEETGLIVPIGNWVLCNACRWIAEVNKGRLDDDLLTINVNVSPVQLRNTEFINEARFGLEEAKLPPGILRLEITEGTVVEHVDTVDEVIAQLKGLNIQLQIDDFGTGYSSLAYLHRLPVDALKIDRSFVDAMESSPEAVQVIRAILALAKGLGVAVVAEGVETITQAEALREMGCTLAQGYYFAKPMAPDAAKTFLAANRASAAAMVHSDK